MHPALVVALIAAPAVIRPAHAAIAERIAVRVNRDAITLTEWEDGVRAAAEAGTPAGTEKAKLAEQVLDRMISERLIVQAAADFGLKVNDSEVEPRVEEQVETLKAKFKTPTEFDAQMKREGITEPELRRRIGHQIKEQYLYLKMLGRKQRDLETQGEAGEAEIEAWYKENKTRSELQTVPQVRARHILFAVDESLPKAGRKAAIAEAKKRAAAAQAALKRGEKFADVAGTFTEDATTKSDGGSLGTFGRGTYQDALEAAVFAAKPGQVTGPVETPAGLHLILVEEALPSRPRTLDETVRVPAPVQDGGKRVDEQDVTVRQYAKLILRNQRMSGAMQAWVDSLKAKAVIVRTPEVQPAL